MTHLQLVVVSGEMDGECHRCGECFGITSIGILEGDDFVCLDCADGMVRGFAQIVRGLDLVHEAVCLDGLRRIDAEAVANVLRVLAKQLDGLARGDMAVQYIREITHVPWEPDGPIGVRIERGIVKLGETAAT